MLSLFTTPFAVFFQLNFFGDEFFVLAGPVIYTLTISAGELDKSIL